MTKTEKTIQVNLDPNPRGRRKAIGGAVHDDWNDRLSALVGSALPVNLGNMRACGEASTAVLSGMIDMKPVDPVEGILIGQLVVAHEAALAMYRRAWQQPSENFEARTKYLQLADKAQRTVATLAERLDQHRGRGQQQIVVKHVTVNADKAVVTDSVVTKSNEAMSDAKFLTAGADKPMEIIESIQKEAVPVVGGGTKAK